ncbi:MAG: SGNH/GDSL hydrolase family protein [Methylobacteriaceae bacterium]|nr:SGNH/GDSL hydrolase family protein [Methylobacteriaceae bacterium]
MRYLILLIAAAAATAVYSVGYNAYTLLLYLLCIFLFLVGLMVAVRGKLRDISLVVASIFFCLILVEAYELFHSGGSLKLQEQIPFAPNPVLGWVPNAPGVFHVQKIDRKTGNLIFEAVQTIDEHLQRKTASAEDAPTIAFFGDSFTYGEGLSDSETLPQIFSDLEDRRLHIVNFGISGYGPQQFLRAMETGVASARLKRPQLFVFQTAAWHAERTSCMHPGMLRSPRYIL